jgi:small subunit ribosomal protein S3
MAQKIKPNAYRLGLTVDWKARWFPSKANKSFLEEDQLIRNLLMKEISKAGIVEIITERSGDNIKVNIQAAKPGVIIGRGGKDIENLKEKLEKAVKKFRKKQNNDKKFSININIEEMKRYDISANVVAKQLAESIEKRIPYKRVMKSGIELIMQTKGVLGAKIKMSGRLDGAEISRSDFLSRGKMPLSSLRANIDYGEATAFNTYGTVGIKVWIYKGDIFEKNNQNQKKEQ